MLSYIVRGTKWYQPLIPVTVIPATTGTSLWKLEDISPPIFTNSNRLWTRAQVNEGANTGPPQTHPRGRSRWRFGGVRWKTSKCTPIYTRKDIRILLNKSTLLSNIIGIFSQASAHRRPLDTERRRRFAPTSGSSLRYDRRHVCVLFKFSYFLPADIAVAVQI